MPSFHKNLKSILDKKGLNTVSFGEIMGVSAGAVGFWQNGSRFPKAETIQRIIESLDITAIDLFGEDEDKRRITKTELKENLNNYIESFPNINIPPALKQITVTKGFPTISTSANTTIQEDSMQYVTKVYIDKRMVKTAYQDKELEAVVMVGDSMSPYLENDDIAIYHPTLALGDGRYVINTPHGLTIKKLKFMTSGSVLLISENTDYNTQGTFDEEFTAEFADTLEVLGLVVGRILKS